MADRCVMFWNGKERAHAAPACVRSVMGDCSAVLLCVDDDPDGLRIRKLVLERAGYRVLTAASGEEAMSLIASRAPDLLIDLLITDQLLPSMLGTQLAAEAKRLCPELRVLILSGLFESPDAAHADGFLCKLDGPAALLERIPTMLKAAAFQRRSSQRTELPHDC